MQRVITIGRIARIGQADDASYDTSSDDGSSYDDTTSADASTDDTSSNGYTADATSAASTADAASAGSTTSALSLLTSGSPVVSWGRLSLYALLALSAGFGVSYAMKGLSSHGRDR